MKNKTDCPDKLEPLTLNIVARQILSDQISEQMARVRNKMIWEIKAGLDEAEFARIRALTDDMLEVENHIELAAKRWNNTFQMYADKMRKLLTVSAQIRGSEK